jgi:septum formation protein
MLPLFLASESPARLKTLQQVGINPLTLGHDVDEEGLVATATEDGPIPASEMVQLLATAKAHNACEKNQITGLVLGGDSLFEVDGEIFGKPHTAENARTRWHRQKGQTGTLYSGHHLLHCVDGNVVAQTSLTTSSDVRFASDISDDELEAYIATGEPLKVAGAFTIDAKGAAFIESISGDPYTVVGLSVHALRQMVRALGLNYTDLWE